MAPIIRRKNLMPQYLPPGPPQASAHLPLLPSPETALVQIGMHDLSSVSQYAVQKAALTVAIAERIREASALLRSMTPEQEVQFADQVEAYLNELLTIAHRAGLEMMGILREQG